MLLAELETGHKFELRDITVRFPEELLAVVTGPTASGKTAVLVRRRVPPPSAFAHLGHSWYCLERWHNKARTSCPKNTENGDMHAISHAVQSPWLRHQSIKDNTHPLMRSRIMPLGTVPLGSLILEDGDATAIGARGVSLFGGQKDLQTFWEFSRI